MKVVIDIPDEEYARIMSMDHFKRTYEQDMIYDGTPFPKHHGRLIDADELKDVFKYTEDADVCKWSTYGVISEIDDAPTVIEAESE